MSSVIIPDQDGNSVSSVVTESRKILFLVLSLVLFRACLVVQLRMLDQLCPITIVNIYLKGCGQIKVGVAKQKFPAHFARR